MALFPRRSFVTAVAPLMVAASLLLSPGARAASDPCKADAKSTACKAAKTKAAPKKTTTVTQSTTVTKSGAKTTVSKTESKTTTVAKKSASGKTSTKSTKRVVADTKTRNGKKVVHHASSSRKSTARAEGADHPLSTAAQAAALRSSVAYVQDLQSSTVLFAKNEDTIRPIASISKLMTALVVVDANQPMDETLEITDDDVDRLRHAASRLPVGTRLTRADMLHLALMSSENRAAHALGRYYPGGMPAFVKAMNAKARDLGMMDTHFVEPTGLSSENVSSPRDLVRLLRAAAQRPLIHRYTTDSEYDVDMGKGHTRTFRNTNALVRNANWDIKVSKTGFINEAGECLVMLAHIDGRDLAIVLLDSQGKYSRIGDAIRIRKFVQNEVAMM
jgi:D-alanyl-D-alanine endopeptidase (penicillin-binding protein 7)